MNRLIVLLTAAVVVGAGDFVAQAEDGKVYRLCGIRDRQLLFEESRKPVVRPVVALPVEKASGDRP